jgi:DNA-binding transcriptional LysR family regulator
MLDVIEAMDRLKRAAGDQHKSSRIVRLGTVSAATAPVLTLAIRDFRESHPNTQVEVVTAQQKEIQKALLDGSLDLGLINYLEDDDISENFATTELLRGRPVVVIHPDDPIAAHTKVDADDLAGHSLVMMRAGYVMHRYLTGLLGDREPTFSYSTDGAEMGKLMVAEGLGAAVLPDYSVIGDPLETRGAITFREIDDDTGVHLVIQRRAGAPPNGAVRDLHDMFVSQSAEYADKFSLPRPVAN